MNPFPPLAMAEGGRIDDLFVWALVLTGIAFALVLSLLVYFCVRYRGRGRVAGDYLTGENPRAFGFTFAFALLVFVGIDLNLAIRDHAAWAGIFEGPFTGPPVRVEVEAKRFEWLFRYPGPDGDFGTPDDRTTLGRMIVPVGRTVETQMTSRDVIHSFFLPNVRLKQDVLPGMTTRLRFRLDREGEFDIACAELCGMGHYTMRGTVAAVAADSFDASLAEIAETGDTGGWRWGEER